LFKITNDSLVLTSSLLSYFDIVLSYVQGGWKHYKEKFTVMKKSSEFKSGQASDIGQGGNKLW